MQSKILQIDVRLRWNFVRIAALALCSWMIASCGVVHSKPSQSVFVIDGDTVQSDHHHYRLLGFDTPEVGPRAHCAEEDALGKRASARLHEIVEAGEIKLVEHPCTCLPGTEGTSTCNYGRRCAVLLSHGKDVAKTLIEEGLARPYICDGEHCPQRSDWCH
ncbi:MAG: thermonuclease family protein [Alphaproteobacteria bacterium]|nr:thermonuclease family protein [Alphaproteobacteria bacterium]